MTHDSKELLERLKYYSGWSTRNVPGIIFSDAAVLCWDAIDEIERLRALQPTPQQSADAVKQSFDSYYLNAGV